MQTCPAPKKMTHRTSGRKQTTVDYSQFDIIEGPPSAAKKKKN